MEKILYGSIFEPWPKSIPNQASLSEEIKNNPCAYFVSKSCLLWHVWTIHTSLYFSTLGSIFRTVSTSLKVLDYLGTNISKIKSGASEKITTPKDRGNKRFIWTKFLFSFFIMATFRKNDGSSICGQTNQKNWGLCSTQ